MDSIESRLNQFLQMEELSPARFADMLGIQRSGISHLLSGRNNPSYDFLKKMLEHFPELSADWLLMGKGKPYKNASQNTYQENPVDVQLQEIPTQLFDFEQIETELNVPQPREIPIFETETEDNTQINQPNQPEIARQITRIIIFYSDGTYEEK